MFSGIQPTGDLHLGNYLGAVRNWVQLQADNECFFTIVDLHAMTEPWDAAVLSDQTLRTAASLIACGVDPDKAVLFVQSDVAEHTELTWALLCIARMGELRRMIQFKEKSKGETESVGVGLFTYPVLQTADVLLYQAHGVPVGDDQRQHVELMRDLALRFNQTFGETFVVPEAWIPATGARVMALDDPTQKMSKSAARPASSILLVDPPEIVTKKLKAAVTDSGRDVRAGDDKPALTNLLGIFSLLEGTPVAELEARFEGVGYGDFKTALAEAAVTALDPIRARYEELSSDPAELERLLRAGAERARSVAASTIAAVRAAVGLAAERR
ncbi:MAG: tryptophan--tRNA ligase [Actinomycetota bacterium]|nr:tryptophan--tRNA ligase [Actinomycetota bacterium]